MEKKSRSLTLGNGSRHCSSLFNCWKCHYSPYQGWPCFSLTYGGRWPFFFFFSFFYFFIFFFFIIFFFIFIFSWFFFEGSLKKAFRLDSEGTARRNCPVKKWKESQRRSTSCGWTRRTSTVIDLRSIFEKQSSLLRSLPWPRFIIYIYIYPFIYICVCFFSFSTSSVPFFFAFF